jgi:hypothetical protein
MPGVQQPKFSDPKVILGLLAFCVQVIAAAAYFYLYDHMVWDTVKIFRGYAPNRPCGVWRSDGDYNCGPWISGGWYAAYTVFAFGILSLIFAIVELVLVFMPIDIIKELFGSDGLRAIVYIFKGLATLGVSNDLGVAAGSLEIIVGGILIILVIYGKMKGGGS